MNHDTVEDLETLWLHHQYDEQDERAFLIERAIAALVWIVTAVAVAAVLAC